MPLGYMGETLNFIFIFLFVSRLALNRRSLYYQLVSSWGFSKQINHATAQQHYSYHQRPRKDQAFSQGNNLYLNNAICIQVVLSKNCKK
jgi:hypothetical protein